jgi:nitrate reductase / nitrite oxidoreductase, alpha subunit
MNSTSCWYAHTDQWRYETVTAKEILSPTAPEGDWAEPEPDRLQHPRRADGLAALGAAAEDQPAGGGQGGQGGRQGGQGLRRRAAEIGRSGDVLRGPRRARELAAQPVRLALEPAGSSGKGHEYFLKHLLGTDHGVLGKDLGEEAGRSRSRRVWHDKAPEGKLDLLVCIDFRMSTTAVYSDIVLPTASWYEKDDLNTSDMHPFIHPLQAAVDPAYESKSDWEIFKAIAKKFSEVAPEILGVETDVVQLPCSTTAPARSPSPSSRTGSGRVRPDPRQDRAGLYRGRAGLSEPLRPLHRARPADGEGRQRRQGHRLGHQDEVHHLQGAQRHR